MVKKALTIFLARVKVKNQPDKQMILASVCSLLSIVSFKEKGTTARTPLILLAAIHIPWAEPQTKIPKDLFLTTALATFSA